MILLDLVKRPLLSRRLGGDVAKADPGGAQHDEGTSRSLQPRHHCQCNVEPEQPNKEQHEHCGPVDAASDVVDADAVENAHRRIISTFSPDQRVPARRDGPASPVGC